MQVNDTCKEYESRRDDMNKNVRNEKIDLCSGRKAFHVDGILDLHWMGRTNTHGRAYLQIFPPFTYLIDTRARNQYST